MAPDFQSVSFPDRYFSREQLQVYNS
jgi:hypothetical protein